MLLVQVIVASLTVYYAIADMGYEGVLAAHLFGDYSADTRPRASLQENVDVNIMFLLAKIEKIDEKNQQLFSFGWIKQSWYDAHLEWDAAAFGNTSILFVPASKVWRPEMSLLNSMDNLADLSYLSDSRVSIDADGLVTWMQGLRWVTQCTFSLKYFPFDTQACDVIFVNWVHTENYINYNNSYPDVMLDLYGPNGEWELKTAHTFYETIVYDSPALSGARYPMIGFQMVLERISTHYVYSIVIPVVLLMFVTVLVFALPTESGEKVSMQVTLLLAHSVMALVIADSAPRSGKVTPILTEYIATAMLMTAASLAINVFTLSLFHHSPEKTFPGWIKTFVLDIIAPCVGLKCARPCRKNKISTSSSVRTLGKASTTITLVQTDSNQDGVIGHLQVMDDIIAQNREDLRQISKVLERLGLLVYLIIAIAITSVELSDLWSSA